MIDNFLTSKFNTTKYINPFVLMIMSQIAIIVAGIVENLFYSGWLRLTAFLMKGTKFLDQKKIEGDLL